MHQALIELTEKYTRKRQARRQKYWQAEIDKIENANLTKLAAILNGNRTFYEMKETWRVLLKEAGEEAGFVVKKLK